MWTKEGQACVNAGAVGFPPQSSGMADMLGWFFRGKRDLEALSSIEGEREVVEGWFG